MKSQIRYSLFLVLFILLGLGYTPVEAQKRREVKYTASGFAQKVGRGNDSYIRLMKDVRFDIKSKKTIITGDSSYYFEKRGFMQVFGRVMVREGDSTTITGRRLDYNLETRDAKFRQNVIYKSGKKMTLFTDNLDYDFQTKKASYFEGGRVEDNTTKLNSKNGVFDQEKNTITFTGDVVLVSPDFTLKSSKLVYNQLTKIATTTTPTEIINADGTVVNAEKGGVFNTVDDQTTLTDATIETETYRVKANKISFDDIKKIYTAKGNVVLTGKEDDMVIYGDESKFSKEGGLSKVYGNPLLKKLMNNDTLYLTADTLASFDSDIKTERYLLAYNNVKILSLDISGIADSLSYQFSDSTINFFTDPVLWSDESQIEADSITVQLAYNKIDKMFMDVNSFIITQDTVKNFNQIKGRNMTAFFKDGSMDKLYVYGNGESIYFALENEVDVVGMNKIFCSDMIIRLIDNKVDNITFYTNPDAVFIPPHELLEPETRLPGFRWRLEERPGKNNLPRLDGAIDSKKPKNDRIKLN